MKGQFPPPHEKASIAATCQRFIDAVLKPRFLPEVRPTEWNYCVDIFGKWHGPRYRFIQRYRSGFADTLGEEFDAPFVRLDWRGRNRFDIMWRRHTGTWHCVYQNLPLHDALKAIEADGILHPL